MGSESSKLVLAVDNKNTKESKNNNGDDASWSDVGMVDVDLPVEECLAALPSDPESCFECLSLPFKLCIGLCLE